MGRIGVDDLEDLRSLRLDDQSRAELLRVQTECTFVFVASGGWPSGVVMSFLYAKDRFWLTAVRGRAHAESLRTDPRVCVVVSSQGTALPGRRMVAVRGVAVVHRDRPTLDWFLAEFAAKLGPADPAAFTRLLDSPKRVVFEVTPVAVAASHDSRRMPGDGRGGAGPADALVPGPAAMDPSGMPAGRPDRTTKGERA